LTFESVDRQAADVALRSQENWLVIDLSQKRVCTGRGFFEIGRDQAFTMVGEEQMAASCPLSVHLPPWWEMHEQIDVDAWAAPRESELVPATTNRDVLYGEPLLQCLAEKVLTVIRSADWSRGDAARQPTDEYDFNRDRYSFTKKVHREWLMTPRSDLGDRTPRSHLHGGKTWIERVTRGQQIRGEDGGAIVAIPDDMRSYATAPMGLEEVVMYFGLCRALIEAGWTHCMNTASDPNDATRCDRSRLIAHLRGVRQRWLNEPYEDDAPPQLVIEYSRRRVPRAPGVPIVGMDQPQPEEHAEHCDCPMCTMMANGLFGPGFIQMDGHYLELDDDFAFSRCETMEEWEAEQMEFQSLSDSIDYEIQQMHEESTDCPEEFQSVWSGSVSDEPLPGDPNGVNKLAFLLCEIVDELRRCKCEPATIVRLTECFRRFQTSEVGLIANAGKELNQALEDLCGDFPDLVARIADFQSRVDECLRMPIVGDDPDGTL